MKHAAPYQIIRLDDSFVAVNKPAGLAVLPGRGRKDSLIGLLTTLVNVATAQNGNLSLTAKVTVAVTTAVGGSMLGLSVLYGQLLDNLITDRDREVAQHGHP